MAASNIALVLVLVLGTTLAWENLPAIPANRRAQFFLQHDDGAYKYGYDTGDGHSGQASADAANQVQGEYSYVDRDGQKVNLQYTAGDGGFVPVIGAASSGAFGARSSGVSSRAHSAHSGVVPVASAYTGDSSVATDADFDENADASYNFNIDTDSYKRTETADAKGNIQGQYSYNSPVGGSHAISYIAGEGTGFVVTSDETSAPQQGYSSASQKSSASSGYNYQAPQQTYLPPATSYAGASSDGQTKFNPDGSFAFSYTTSDHNHQSAADANNNVRGSYSFKSADDGQTRKVDYVAGAATGYVATGDHLPVAGGAGFKSFASHGSTFGQGSAAHYSAPAPAPTNYAAPSSSNIAQSDGSYSFSYQTDDHSHHAASDPKGNVAGSFSYVAGDGVSRKIDYTAGADKGFVVKGAHLPVAPVASGAVGYSAHSSGSSGHSQAASSNVGGGYQYAAPATGGYSAGSDDNNDGSYSYSYDTGSSSKQETADAKGNVAGTFSFLGGDGVNRKLSYTARAEEGFVVKGDHLPVAPVAGSGHEVGISGRNAFASSVNTRSGSNAHDSSSGNVMASKDGAYSYSYSTGGQNSAAPAFKSSGQNAFGSGAGKSFSLPVAASSSHGSSAGQVMASKDGAYSYSYSTGGQNSAAPAFKSSNFGQNSFGSGAVKSYSSPVAASSSHGSSAGQVMASKDGEYSYAYSTGGQDSAAPSFKSSASGHSAFGSGAAKSYSSPVAKSGSHGSSSGQVMASKDGAYSYSYTTGGQSAPVAHASRTAAYTGGQSGISAPSHSGRYAAASSSADEGGDASYSYSYNTDTSSKQETSDAKGNVVGSFSYVGGDGVNRKLSYTAKNEQGFNAAGDHLPVAPSVDSGSHSSSFGAVQATGYSHPTAKAHSSGHAHNLETRDGNVVISKYLPPSPKFGYIFDTKA